jgi:endonuclease/exonuclease/phosphatase family metal-dependent hydrolase
VRVLTWNLKHGRAVPPAGRELFEEFAAALAGWEWDVALLQEVPPWWPSPLATRTGAAQRHVLTSRNALLAVRRGLATRWPDVIKSNGGGCDAILVRGARGRSIAEHRTRRLSLLPERRWVHAVLADGLWVANLHAEADVRQARVAAQTVLRWAGEMPAVLGGDFNVRSPSLPGFTRAGGCGVDQVYVRGLHPVGDPTVLQRGRLSDHDPVLVTMA